MRPETYFGGGSHTYTGPVKHEDTKRQGENVSIF